MRDGEMRRWRGVTVHEWCDHSTCTLRLSGPCSMPRSVQPPPCRSSETSLSLVAVDTDRRCNTEATEQREQWGELGSPGSRTSGEEGGGGEEEGPSRRGRMRRRQRCRWFCVGDCGGAWGIMMAQLATCSGGTTDVVISSFRKQAAGHAANDSCRGVERNGIGDLQRARDGQDANRARERKRRREC
jgi:hypothetical protein